MPSLSIIYWELGMPQQIFVLSLKSEDGRERKREKLFNYSYFNYRFIGIFSYTFKIVIVPHEKYISEKSIFYSSKYFYYKN